MVNWKDEFPIEGILIMYKKVRKKQKGGISTISQDDFLELNRGIWKIPTVGDKYTKANFPERLPELCIRGLSYKDDLVLDPFIGSGRTAVVAGKLNRRWIGIEISEGYCEVAKQRTERVLMEKSQNLFNGLY